MKACRVGVAHGTIAALLATALGVIGCGGSSEPAPRIDGTWLGAVTVRGAPPLRIVFNLAVGAGGDYAGTVDVPEQGVLAHPVSTVELAGREVAIAIAEFGASFTGTLSEDGASIPGTFVQAGQRPLPGCCSSPPTIRRRSCDGHGFRFWP